MQDPQRSLRIQCKSSRSSGDKELVGLFQRQAAAVCAQGPCALQHIDAAAARRAVHRQGVGDVYFVQTEERRIVMLPPAVFSTVSGLMNQRSWISSRLCGS